MVVFSRIYWKAASEDTNDRPPSLADFRGAISLELIRLEQGTWNEVDKIIKVDDYEGRARITVRGRLHGRKRRNTLNLVRDAEIEIIASTPEQHQVWLDKIRVRIAPWNLLQQEMKDLASRAPSSGVEELGKTVGGLAPGIVGIELSSTSPSKMGKKWRDKLSALPEQMKKLSILDDLTAHGAGTVGSTATLTKLVASVECVKETAELLGDLSKFVGCVSSIFKLVSLSAQGVAMWAEAKRGETVLPVALGQITALLRYILESLGDIMEPSRIVKQTAIDFAFDALKECVCIMDLAETQALRGRVSQIMNPEDVKKVEEKVKELKQMAVVADNTSGIAINTSKINALDKKVNGLEEKSGIRVDAPFYVRPSVSAFFSGRKTELKTLKQILENHGSAVITQCGGMGKTELMTALADQAERDKAVPGGVFWVTVDGAEMDLVESLAGLAEKLTRRKMDEEERRNPNLVVIALKQGLDEREAPWLLCLDNADDSRVSGVLNEVCAIAQGTKRNGWVVVTSRQSQPHIWSTMKSEQKLVLKPLSADDSMVALWRQTRKIQANDTNDYEVINAIKKLQKDDADEHNVFKELCGDKGECSLGGLPLALVQAGSYIAQFGCSFAQYLNMLKNANSKEWEDFMKKSDELKLVRDSQRSIWTTWKISVEKLSGTACVVLQAMAMLGQGGIEESIVKGILKAAAADGGGNEEKMFLNLFVQELMHGSSLIWCDEGEGEGRNMFRMHRLVQLFILNNIVRGSTVWENAYSLALRGLHHCVETELQKESKSFYELPDVLENNHRELAAHSLALVHHHVLPVKGNEIRNVSEATEIYWYCGNVMQFTGKLEGEVRVWEHLSAIFIHQDAEYRRRNCIERLLDVWYRRNRGKEVKSSIARVYNQLGSAYMRDGSLRRAALKLEQSLKMRRAIHGRFKPHPDIAMSLNDLGNVYQLIGKLDKALKKHKESYKICQAIHRHGESHPVIPKSISSLGVLYERMGELDKALEKHEQSLEIRRAIHGHSKLHPDIATSIHNLGVVYERMGKLAKALNMLEESLEMRREIHRHDMPHPAIAISLNNIGVVYLKIGELEKALEKHEQSLEIGQAVYGRNTPHPVIACSLNHLGVVYERMGKLENALEKHDESLKMRRTIYGPDKPHLDVAMSMNNLGVVYMKLGQLEEALEKHEESLRMRRAICRQSKLHPDVAMSLNHLGVVYERMGKLEKAREKHDESLKIRRAIHGLHKPHPVVAMSLTNLGVVHTKLGQLDKALETFEESLKMSRAIHGDNKPHRDIAMAIDYIGIVCGRKGELDDALEKLERSLEMKRAIHGYDVPHPDIAMSLTNLGVVHTKLGQLDKALEIFEESLNMSRAIHGDNKPHRDIAMSIGYIGIVYEQMDELDDALEKLERSLEMKRAIHGYDVPHPDIAMSLSNLRVVHMKLGELDKALEAHVESRRMGRAIHGDNKSHLGNVIHICHITYVRKRKGNQEEGQETPKEMLDIIRAIHEQGKADLDTAMFLCTIGITAVRSGDEELFETYAELMKRFLCDGTLSTQMELMIDKN